MNRPELTFPACFINQRSFRQNSASAFIPYRKFSLCSHRLRLLYFLQKYLFIEAAALGLFLIGQSSYNPIHCYPPCILNKQYYIINL